MYFTSDFADVSYRPNDGVVFLTWKREAHLTDYREPTTAALELLRQNPGSSFVIDARNGFEDDKRDVEWGFTYLLPEMASAGCKKIGMIMNVVNDIEGEMDMWTREFEKYFCVFRAEDYERLVKMIS